MRPSTAAALVGAALISTIVFPVVGRVLRQRTAVEELPATVVEAQPVSVS